MLSSVAWPCAPFTESLVLKSLSGLSIQNSVVSLPPNRISNESKLLQWSTYDEIDHELTHLYRDQCLSSSYTIRKALIRKHFLSRCIGSYIVKNPSSLLTHAYPKTYEIEISFADELDEQWADELWELAEMLEGSNSWWILKPGMADRGMGIRLFNSRDALRSIFQEFESDSEDEPDDGFAAATHMNPTSVVTSQLRHFVAQEYLGNPLLMDPSAAAITDHAKRNGLTGHKFHLRAYCVAKGALELYLYDRVLALFSAVPYQHPRIDEESTSVDLTPHLTNTSLQSHRGEEGVRLLEQLVGCQILSGNRDKTLTDEYVNHIVHQMSEILSETFKAALQVPVHFQALPNAFELFGVDFLVIFDEDAGHSEPFPFHVKLLEVNAEPAIELTGPKLSWILEDLFAGIRKVCIEPFFESEKGDSQPWTIGETRDHLIKCLEQRVRA